MLKKGYFPRNGESNGKEGGDVMLTLRISQDSLQSNRTTTTNTTVIAIALSTTIYMIEDRGREKP